MEPDNPDLETRKLDLEYRRVELDAEMRRAELEEKRAARESADKTQDAANLLKSRELEITAGKGLRVTAAQATIIAAAFTLFGGAIGAFITAYVNGRENIQLEQQKLETTLILNATKSDSLNDRINNLKFLVKAGLINDREGKIEKLIKEGVVPVSPGLSSSIGLPSAISNVTCPTEAHWTYSQSTGNLCHAGQQIAAGYSGFGDGKNNTGFQSVADLGPIPQGDWIIEAPQNTAEHGPYVLPLTPGTGTNTFQRSGFVIHGDVISEPGHASRGSVILPRNVREQIWNSGDTHLHVVP